MKTKCDCGCENCRNCGEEVVKKDMCGNCMRGEIHDKGSDCEDFSCHACGSEHPCICNQKPQVQFFHQEEERDWDNKCNEASDILCEAYEKGLEDGRKEGREERFYACFACDVGCEKCKNKRENWVEEEMIKIDDKIKTYKDGKPSETSAWEERFDRLFVDKMKDSEELWNVNISKDIKAFIQNLLDLQKKDLIEEIEKVNELEEFLLKLKK